ncbi:hypothetical protein Peur_061933 [Populus x canadensis]
MISTEFDPCTWLNYQHRRLKDRNSQGMLNMRLFGIKISNISCESVKYCKTKNIYTDVRTLPLRCLSSFTPWAQILTVKRDQQVFNLQICAPKPSLPSRRHGSEA